MDLVSNAVLGVSILGAGTLYYKNRKDLKATKTALETAKFTKASEARESVAETISKELPVLKAKFSKLMEHTSGLTYQSMVVAYQRAGEDIIRRLAEIEQRERDERKDTARSV